MITNKIWDKKNYLITSFQQNIKKTTCIYIVYYTTSMTRYGGSVFA
uniref:Uncharacterized protein n=1 Tax=Ciona intestinalis TaxID=7719 RepID=H2Y1N9_CIOIN